MHFLRWVYAPSSPSVATVSVAINPSSQLLALGLAHGRVALFTLQSLLTLRRSSTAGSGQGLGTGGAAAVAGAGGPRAVPGQGGAAAAAGGAAVLPDPLRVLSLTDWGWSSTITGAAAVMQWSPDGRVLAVGYGRRGMAVWTPSGCRLMCSLRQAAPAATPLSAALQPGVQGVYGGAATPRHPGGTEQPQTQFHAAGPEPSGSSPSSPLGRGNGKSVLSHPSLLNPQVVAAEVGVLEVRAVQLSLYNNSWLSAAVHWCGKRKILSCTTAAAPAVCRTRSLRCAGGPKATSCWLRSVAVERQLASWSRTLHALWRGSTAPRRSTRRRGMATAAHGMRTAAAPPTLQLLPAEQQQMPCPAGRPRFGGSRACTRCRRPTESSLSRRTSPR